MLSLIEFLEEIERNDQMVRIPAGDVERLVKRYGARVRSMGQWNKTTDGSVDIAIANIAAVTRDLGAHALGQALSELRSANRLADALAQSSAARRLIEALADLHSKQFWRKWSDFRILPTPQKQTACGPRFPESCSNSKCRLSSGTRYRPA